MTHPSTSWRAESRHAVGLVLAVTAGLTLVLALFVGVAVNSGPHGVRLAVAGPPAAAGQIAAELAAAAGPDAFEVDAVADPAQARTALQERTVDGAIVLGPTGPTVLIASAGSPAIAQLLTTASAHLGPDGAAAATPVVDVVPLSPDDSHGAGLPAGSLPMVLAGLALGAAAALSLRNRWVVLGAVAGGAVAIGLSFAGVLAWLGVVGGAYLAASSAIALTVAVSALVVAGSTRLLGAAGLAVGALLLMIIGSPLSGIASSPRLLPAPWGEFGQWLPTGAGGTLLRSVTYFPDAAIGFPVWVLLAWGALGLLGVLFGRRGPSATGVHPAGHPERSAPERHAVEPVT
ncbi:ABC transporter permease [Nakamurella sp.]|uniref:ABC transporter permease n=1 Tax=Nakamurella sp. TaxID=1869182 RepID=UPI0037849394